MYMPIIIMNAILFVVTVLIAVADRLLVTYGECRIVVRQGQKTREITAQGGATLLSYLVDNKVEISSSCGRTRVCTVVINLRTESKGTS